MELFYRIADVTLILVCDKKYSLPHMDKFQVDRMEYEGDCLTITLLQNRYETMMGVGLVSTDYVEVYETSDSYIYRYKANQESIVAVHFKNDNQSEIYLDERKAVDNEVLCALRDAFLFHAPKMDRMAIHSASLVYRGRAWLFAAPAGTGKTTHVNLWKELEYPVSDLNGDMTICYRMNGVTMAAGSPWCGTSEIYENKVVPLGGILFLKRSKENDIQAVSRAEMVLNIVARNFGPNWNSQLLNRNFSLAEMLCEEVAGRILLCNMDQRAAMVAKEYIDSVM